MLARRLMLFLRSALLLERMGSPSSSKDLLELELRCEDVTDGLLARYLSISWSMLLSSSFRLAWRKLWMSSEDRSALPLRMALVLRRPGPGDGDAPMALRMAS